MLPNSSDGIEINLIRPTIDNLMTKTQESKLTVTVYPSRQQIKKQDLERHELHPKVSPAS